MYPIAFVFLLFWEVFSYGMLPTTLFTSQASYGSRKTNPSNSNTAGSGFNAFELGNRNGVQIRSEPVKVTPKMLDEISAFSGSEFDRDFFISKIASQIHVQRTQEFTFHDYQTDSVTLTDSYKKNIELVRKQEQEVQDKFGDSIYSVSQFIKNYSPEEQQFIYNHCIEINKLRQLNSSIKACLDHNEKMIKQFQIQTKQETQKYSTAISAKPITEYQRAELPHLQQTTLKLQAAISQLQQKLAQLKQQEGEIKKKLSAFDGKRTTKIGAHFKAVCDSGNNKESLTYDKRLIDERIEQVERQINRYKDAITQVNSKIEYVKEAIQQYQEMYTKQADAIRNTVDRSQGRIDKNNPMVQALDDTLASKSVFDHKIENGLSDSSRKMLTTNNVASDLYAPTIGNATQAYLSDSVVTVINKTAEHYDTMNPERRVYADATIDACNNAMQTILHGSPEQAIIATTIAHEIAAAEQGFVESFVNGVIQGLSTVIENDIHMVKHPLETLSSVGNAICDVGWFLITAEPDQMGEVVHDLSAFDKFEKLSPQQKVQQVTAFVTSILCPSPLMIAGGIHAAQVMRSAQKTIKSFEKVLQHEAKALEASRGYKITKSIASGSEKTQETQVFVQSTTNIANNIERQKAPLLNRFKEKLASSKKEQLVAATEHGPAKVGTELKLAHEAEEVAKIKGGSSGNQIASVVESPIKISEPETAQIARNIESSIEPNKIDFFPNNLNHIFLSKRGHFLDTPENRQLLLDTATKSNFLGIDKRGNHWFGKVLPNGKQAWVSVRENFIRNGGLNDVPKKFHPETGLCKSI